MRRSSVPDRVPRRRRVRRASRRRVRPTPAPRRPWQRRLVRTHQKWRRAADVADRAHRHDRWGEQLSDSASRSCDRAPTRSILLMKISVGSRMFARLHQRTRVRLNAFHGGHDEHGAIKDAERALDLGDEVTVTGRVDEIDLTVTDRERRDRRADSDPAAAFDVAGVGLGGAGIDASERSITPVSNSRRSVRLVLPRRRARESRC